MDCGFLCHCNVAFSSMGELLEHMSTHGKETMGSPNVKEEEEESSMLMEEDPSQHSPSSSDASGEVKEEAHTCKFCATTFEERTELWTHLSTTHPDRTLYNCSQCPAVFSVKRELATHARMHSGEPPHECGQCGKQFGTRQLLKKHCMWHTGERSHVCPHCSKAFFQKGHLTQHLMIHAGGRPHVCNLCNKTFIFKFDLNRHMKIHNERGHSCARCRRSFLKQSCMEEHMLRCKGGMAPVMTSNGAPMSLPATPKREQQPNNIFSSLPSPFNRDTFDKLSMSSMAPQTCLLCSRTFSSTAELAVHLTLIHFPQNQLAAQLGQQGIAQQSGALSTQQSMELEDGEIPREPLSAFLPIKMEELSSADTATNSSCASSPQKESPSSVEVAEPRDDAATPPMSYSSPIKCTTCDDSTVKIAQLEMALSNATKQLSTAQALLAMRFPPVSEAMSLHQPIPTSPLSQMPSLFSSLASFNRTPNLASLLTPSNLQSLLVKLQ